MTTNPGIPAGSTQTPRTTVRTPHTTSATPTPPADPHVFAMQFTSTRRGARLARHLAAARLDAWGVPYGTAAHEAIVLVVGELTANAVRHGHVPGRDFRLRLTLVPGNVTPGTGTVRIEVTDTRAERLPPRPATVAAEPTPGLTEWGRGLFLVDRWATRWDWHLRADGPGKTVWAEYVLAETSGPRCAAPLPGSDGPRP